SKHSSSRKRSTRSCRARRPITAKRRKLSSRSANRTSSVDERPRSTERGASGNSMTGEQEQPERWSLDRLLHLFELEEVIPDVFKAPNPTRGPWTRVFGGQ